MKRREAIKPDINHAFKKICSAQVPVTNLLFGDDLSARVPGIQDTNTLGRRVQATTTSQHSKNAFSKPRGTSYNLKFIQRQPNQAGRFLRRGSSSEEKPPPSQWRGNRRKTQYRW